MICTYALTHVPEAVGHDTNGIKAKDHAYNSNPACCKYRDKKVVDAHGKIEN